MAGQITTCIDLEAAEWYYNQGWRVICFSEDKQFQAYMPEMMMGSIFLPPYESMDSLLDGNTDLFSMMYSEYLCTNPDVGTMMSIMLMALYRGVNIVLFVPRQEYELGFFNVFVKCFASLTGVFIGFQLMECAFDYMTNNRNMVRLFMEGFLPYNEFMVYFEGPITDPLVCIKICNDIGYITESHSEAMQYIASYKSRIEDNGNQFLKKGFIKA